VGSTFSSINHFGLIIFKASAKYQNNPESLPFNPLFTSLFSCRIFDKLIHGLPAMIKSKLLFKFKEDKIKPLKVLSLFGGLETGLDALIDLGIPIEEYHTYEILKPAIEISSKRFPFIIHHGNIETADWSLYKSFVLYKLLLYVICYSTLFLSM